MADFPERPTPETITPREVFDEWLAAMSPRLAGLEDFSLPADFPFDYSRESLVYLERILLSEYPDKEAVYAAESKDFLDRCVRYIGESLIRNFGGEWRYSTDSDSAISGYPYVVNDDGTDVGVVPLHLITSLLTRRTGGELAHVFDGTKEYYDAYQAKAGTDPVQGPAKESTAEAPDLSDAARAFLERWQRQMPEQLEQWRAGFVPEDIVLDFSKDSLAALEQVVLDRFRDEDEVTHESNADFVEGAVRYLGETLVRAGFAHWHYQDWGDDAPAENVYHRIPYVLSNVPPPDEPFDCVPLWSIQVAVEQRTGETFTEDYDGMREDLETSST
ncbi:hypothetical protein [Actinomadura sp. 9N407]|uniref:hypothetical protein n=1 Tax=Actinomadura sp. 9N407 TaxID=3375154 RepID=UPI0037A0CBF9